MYLHCFSNLAGTNAGRADIFSADFAVDKYSYAPYVRIKRAVRSFVGMADCFASCRFFVADRTFV